MLLQPNPGGVVMHRFFSLLWMVGFTVAIQPHAQAQDVDALAKELANPIASLISVPFQNNFDFGAGPDDDGFAYTLNIQPVIPFSISPDWNLISRTILPLAYRDYIPGGDTFGLGDTLQSLFFSPKAPGPGGLIWGIGPAALVPTATDDALGTGKWAAGPTAVALVQTGPWTVGGLTNHIWSFAGEGSRDEISQTFIQPFAAYALGRGQTITLNSETTYDWQSENWTVPINLLYSKVLTLGTQPVSLQFGARYYAETPDGGPDWGLRASIVFLFPRPQ